MASQLDLNDIRTFVAVAQAGTLSAAARDLGLPTSTVSRSITRLEQSLGLLLVQRSPRGLLITDAGKEYLHSCRRGLRSLRDAGERMERHRGNPGGVIRVSCPVTMARDLLAPVLNDFIDAYPNLRVEIEPYLLAGIRNRVPTSTSSSRSGRPKTPPGVFATILEPAEACTPPDPIWPAPEPKPTPRSYRLTVVLVRACGS